MDFFLGITNKCNLSCPWCSHRNIRSLDPDYEMGKKEFEKWYTLTKKSGYIFDSIDFNGLGEPTCYSDTDFLRYMIIKCSKFTNSVNILSNGTNIDVLRKMAPFCNISISLWKESKEIDSFENEFPSRVFVKRNIVKHDLTKKVGKRIKYDFICGCSGCGYTMGTVFLTCGTWAPKIVKNNLYHTYLKPNYLRTLSKYYGRSVFGMCSRCHANTDLEYTEFEERN